MVSTILIIFVLFLSDVNAQIQAATQEQKTDIIILLDRSGSLLSNDKREMSVVALKAVISELDFIGGQLRVMIIPFATKIHHFPVDENGRGIFTSDFQSLYGEIERYNTKYPVLGNNYTDLEMAILEARQKFNENSDDQTTQHLIVITDGKPEPDPKRLPGFTSAETRNRESADRIVPLVRNLTNRGTKVTIFGLFNPSSGSYKKNKDYIERLQIEGNVDFQHITHSDDMVIKIIEMFPRPDNVIQLFKGNWDKHVLVPERYRISLYNAFVMSGKNLVTSFGSLGLGSDSRSVRDKNGNVSFVSSISSNNSYPKPSGSGFTPILYLEGKTSLKIVLNMSPRRNAYNSGDIIEVGVQVQDEFSGEHVSFSNLKGNIKLPGMSSHLDILAGDKLRVRVPHVENMTRSQITVQVELGPGVKLTKKFDFTISENKSNAFVIDPPLSKIDFGELGQNDLVSFHLSKYKLSLAVDNFKNIDPRISFIFGDGFLQDDWFSEIPKISPLTPSKQSRSLPDVSINLPRNLYSSLENRVYEGYMQLDARGVESMQIPFSFLFISPEWTLDYRYKSMVEEREQELPKATYLNLFNMLFKELQVPLRHNSGYPQQVRLGSVPILEIDGHIIDSGSARLTLPNLEQITIANNDTESIPVKINIHDNSMKSGMYNTALSISSDKLTPIEIPIFVYLINRITITLMLSFVVILLFARVWRQRMRLQILNNIQRIESINLPVTISSDLSYVGNSDYLVFPITSIESEDIRLSLREGTLVADNLGVRDGIRVNSNMPESLTAGVELFEGDTLTVLDEDGVDIRLRFRSIDVPTSRVRVLTNSNISKVFPTYGAAILRQFILPVLMFILADYLLGSIPYPRTEAVLALVTYSAIIATAFGYRKWGFMLFTLTLLFALIFSF